MASIFDWSATAASNTTCDGLNTNTGMTPANVDNVFRSMMALIRNTFASALQNFLAGSAPLPVANGGTGATSAANALTSLGALDANYRNLYPINTPSAGFAFDNTHRACGISYTGSAAAATINPNSTTAIDTGATIVLRNVGSGALTITRGSGVTLKANGSTTSADSVLAVGGVATLVKWGTDDWTITGSGLS